MLYHKICAAALCSLLAVAGGAHARSIQDDTGPAEFPPASYTANQYVDSEGCVYIRAGFAGSVTWVPRVSRDRQVLCGFKPTFATAPVVTPAPKVAAAPVQQPVTPAPQPRVVKAPAPVKAAPVRQSKNHVPACPGASELSGRYINDGSISPVRCGPQPIDPKGRATIVNGTAQPAKARLGRVAAAPAGPQPTVVPQGYQPAWKDGRLNPNRGKGTAEGQAAMDLIWTKTVPRRLIQAKPGKAQAQTYAHVTTPYVVQSGATARVSTKQLVQAARLSSKSVASKPAQAASHRFVQVGSFGIVANAQATISQLRRMGLPVSVSQARIKGAPVQVVYAGPFAAEGQMASALNAVRKAGYRDAFVRK